MLLLSNLLTYLLLIVVLKLIFVLIVAFILILIIKKINFFFFFFIPENEQAIDNEFGVANEIVDQDILSVKKNQTNQPIDSNPSHKMKSDYVQSTDDSKYEIIRRQNDLFLC